MLIIYFLVIILNIALLIVFAILTYFEFVLKGRNGFLKLFFVLFEISYIILFFFYPKKFKLEVEKGIVSVFYCFSANSITAQAIIFNFYVSIWIYRWRYGSPSQSSLAGKTIESVIDSSVDEKC